MTGAPPVEVFIGIGTNIDAERNVRLACRELATRYAPVRLSTVYRTAAVGFDGDDFLNLVAAFRTDQSPEEVVAAMEDIEAVAGRVRGSERFSSRTLDLDVLLFGDRVIDQPGLDVPREDILLYGFVLGPLAELAPDLRHPVTGERIDDIWAGFPAADRPANAVTLAGLGD